MIDSPLILSNGKESEKCGGWGLVGVGETAEVLVMAVVLMGGVGWWRRAISRPPCVR